jgi:nicotinate-nucleotide pyrophosphorylase (carboxylating)
MSVSRAFHLSLADNHIWAAGSITAAVQEARKVGGFSIKIEVESRGLEEALEAASAGADVVMLDNYSPAALLEDAAKIKAAFPKLIIEASGVCQSSLATLKAAM